MTDQRGTEDRLAGFDFARHNAEVRALWESFDAGAPIRTPVILGLNTRFFMRHPAANPDRVDFRAYNENPDVMFDAQLAFQRWSRFNALQDARLGTPDRWQIHVDLQNYYEAAWFGCPVEYRPGEVPDTLPIFAECPEHVTGRGLPGAFEGIMARGFAFYESFLERAQREDFLDRPVEILPPWFGTGSDGPMTVACNLFGAAFVCTAMATQPNRLHCLLEFITDATIRRMEAWRLLADVPVPQSGFGIADDSIALISNSMYHEHILPYHRRIYARFGTWEGRTIHLCGDATRHFTTLRDELNIRSFDTGFPVDFGALRRDLGEDVRIQGGPRAEMVRSCTPGQVRDEARRILESGVLEGGLFVLREGNNLAPGTPLENTEALYHAGREFGYRRDEV